MEENTNPVPETPIDTTNTTEAISEQLVENQQVIYGPAPATSEVVPTAATNPVPEIPVGPANSQTIVTEEKPVTETNTSTVTNTPVQSISNTAETATNATSTTSAISNTAAATTAPNSRITSDAKATIAEDGTISVNGAVATNQDLQEYFDYTKYDDSTSARMVEGVFKSDTIVINGVSYKAELNANGEMVSVGGTSKLTQEEIRSYLGDKGYEALVCKTTKDVSIDENGKITIKDRDAKVNIKIAQPNYDFGISNNSAANSATDAKDTNKASLQAKIKDPKDLGLKSGRSGGGGGGGRSGGGGGGASGGGGGASGGGVSGNPPKGDEATPAGTPVIKVDFAQLDSIRNDLSSLKDNLNTICEDYSGTISALASNGDAWSGMDKDAYISQKKGYASNIGEVSKTLNEFVSYFDTSLQNYEKTEAELAAKEIS